MKLTMTISRRSLLLAAAAAAGVGTIGNAAAELPRGPLRIVVPFAPGGGVDTAARLIARQLQTNTGLAVIVENRAGGNGTVGGRAVQGAPADGNTLLFSASTHVMARHVMASPPYDPVQDFAPVARVAEVPLLMVVAPQLPQRSIREVIEAIRQQPDKWTAAIPALGSPSHIATLMLAQQGGVKLTMAAYRGTAPALTDVAGGHAQILVDSIIALLPMAKEGRVRPIATLSARRSATAPDIPTAAETGYPRLVQSTWYGVWAPRALPEARAATLNRAFNAAVADLSRAGALTPLGIEPVSETIDQFRRVVEADVSRGAELLRAAGFQPE
jgi:tripartite-type tricarboxylate transporter receptor subunit TctC